MTFMTKLNKSRLPALWLILTLVGLAGCQSTEVLSINTTPGTSPTVVAVAPVQERGYSELVLDAGTGKILWQENANELRYPASLTKMMTLYLLFEAVETRRITLDTPFTVSAHAASMPPARLGLPVASTITVRDAATALAVRSANDVAAVVAEHLAGSEEAFARLMTTRARSLGMTRTNFANASGLPDPAQVSTARDMALLALALRSRYPAYQSFFKLEEFRYNGRRYQATNKLLGSVNGVDGMKTGYIRSAGFHLVATAQRGNRRLIAIVMGGETGKARNDRVTELFDQHF
ncbi:D-alanyl-D-alanine carboxypeptidase [Aureimonas fodinaquatilis]|uniref:D-alanyl-D-alanine carboxypeptidase n=1 Tax=Aureimonas fodinaquatilis TaxID=2565783 RepID=A0A5B0DZ13_9HYPH|nr:D-alanyl-D-alanine carboxypeptidase family protein [Aureimonas fodinaquatilis]KAA0971001.1 D-alanyl-D-alanine carboxypeptidase [Aureimonas fodinaquatilis]